MTEKSQAFLKWSVPILATLTALVGVEELLEVRGVAEILGLLLAIATAVVGYIAAFAKPPEDAAKLPSPVPAQPAKTK